MHPLKSCVCIFVLKKGTYKYTRPLTCTHVNVNLHTYIHHPPTHTITHSSMHTQYTCTHTQYTHMRTRTHACARMHARTSTHTHTNIHNLSHTHYKHTHTQSYTLQAHTYRHRERYTDRHTKTQTDTQTQTERQTNAQTHAHTQAHIDTPLYFIWNNPEELRLFQGSLERKKPHTLDTLEIWASCKSS